MWEMKVRQSFPFDNAIKAFIKVMSDYPLGRQGKKLNFAATAFMYTSASLASRNYDACKAREMKKNRVVHSEITFEYSMYVCSSGILYIHWTSEDQRCW